jgi:hypothetical protein
MKQKETITNMLRKLIVAMVCLTAACTLTGAQTKLPDSIVVSIGHGSKMLIQVIDRRDLETLKYYNFQALIADLIRRLEQNDTSRFQPPNAYLQPAPPPARTPAPDSVFYQTWPLNKPRGIRHRRTYHSLNLDLATNNFLQNGNFVDPAASPYTVRPWGSWYVGLNSVQRTRVAKKLFLEWGAGVSFYNFKFQNDNLRVLRGPEQITFADDDRGMDAVKSKLTASYINASFVPVIDFGGTRRKPGLFEGIGENSLRIGAGFFAGYRMGSHTKFVYEDAGNRRRDRDHDSFYLNNLRYGVRLQAGFNEVDFFFTYDLNPLFMPNRGPELNAFAFGITL